MPSNHIKSTLSAARLGTYETLAGGSPGLAQMQKALSLYMWNAQVSSAFLVPLHLCEIVIRNAISDVLAAVYGPEWPWSPGFERSLPKPAKGYRPTDDLINARRNQHTTSKVIPELKFVFWQMMLTGRFDKRLWNKYLVTAFPNAGNQTSSSSEVRQRLYTELELIRKLRNRIAHHEPILSRVLYNDFMVIKMLISTRCAFTAEWMVNNQTLLPLLTRKP